MTASAPVQVVTRCDRPHCTWNFVGTELRGRSFLEAHLRLMHGWNGSDPAGGNPVGTPLGPALPKTNTATIEPEVQQVTAATGTGHWTRDSIIGAIRTWHTEHGVLPVQRDWISGTDDHPSVFALKKVFPAWADAIAAAGFTRPTRGGAGPKRSVGEPKAGERGAVLSSPVPAAEPEQRPTSVAPAVVLVPSPSPERGDSEARSPADDTEQWLATLTLDRGGLQQEIYRLNATAEQARTRSLLLSRFIDAIDETL